jgi:AAA domain/Nuclease-related domain
MARMFPEVGPQNTGSTRAEPDIYWRLSKQLSDEFIVIHSLPWLASAAKEIDGRSVPTGEIDFLVLHQELGILAVEVKGGIFTHDRTEFVYKKTGERIDPIRQVRRGTHALAQWLHESGYGSWRIGYCILFPHSEIREAIPIALIDRTVNPPQLIVLDINALNNLGENIRDVMIYWKQALDTRQIKQKQLEKLVDVILPSSDYTPCWQTRIKNDIVTWLHLTSEQANCLRKIEQETRLVVTGFPGTGKTLLLIEHARRLAASGQEILVLTYNALLAKRLRYELSDLSIEVCTFHEQCRRAARVTGYPLPGASNSSEQENDRVWYSTDGPNALQQAVNERKLKNYGALIIDEGQVLHIDWWQTLCKWLDDKRIIVFCDLTQSFSFENSTSPREIAEAINAKFPYTLTINLRSPRTVFERILEVKSTEYQQFCPRPLELDTLTEIAVEDMGSTLEQVVHQLLHEESIPAQSMVLIDATLGSRKEEEYLGIQVVSAAKFRGLEAPVVIIWAGSGSDEISLFCAYTRATSRCIVIYDALGVLQGSYKTFGEIILELDKTGNIQREANLGLTSGIFDEQKFNLIPVANKTISLCWCSDWAGWVIYPKENKPIAQLMWTYHLIVTTNHPVYTWKLYDRGKLQYFEPVRGLDHSSGRFCNLDFCEYCGFITPFISTVGRGMDKCAVCSCEKNRLESLDIKLQSEFDRILSMGAQALIADKKRLSIFLMALGRWNLIIKRQKLGLENYVPICSGTIGYNVAHLLILTDIIFMDENQDTTLKLNEAATKYRANWCPDLIQRIDEKVWYGMVANGFNTWFGKKVIEKVERGIYKRTASFKQIIQKILES